MNFKEKKEEKKIESYSRSGTEIGMTRMMSRHVVNFKLERVIYMEMICEMSHVTSF